MLFIFKWPEVFTMVTNYIKSLFFKRYKIFILHLFDFRDFMNIAIFSNDIYN